MDMRKPHLIDPSCFNFSQQTILEREEEREIKKNRNENEKEKNSKCMFFFLM